MLPKAAVCEKREGEGCHKQPRAGRLPEAIAAERRPCVRASVEGCEKAKARGTTCEGKEAVRRDSERQMECSPKAAVCEKRQGNGCHKGPCARGLQKYENWRQAAECGKTAKGNAGKVPKRRKLPREAQKQPCTGRVNAAKSDRV